MRSVKQLSKFRQGAQKALALNLANEQDAGAWNAWRGETDIFGDHFKTRVDLSDGNILVRDLRGFLLSNVSFYRADLSNSNLSETDCGFSDFHLARLLNAQFIGANLKNSRLSRAYLRGARLDRADLRNADFRRSSVTGASFFRADVRGVDLSSTRGLTQEQIDLAIGDGRTTLPPHLVAPEIWVSYEEDGDLEDDLSSLRSLPATVEVTVNGGILQLSSSPGDAFFSSSVDPESIKRELISDLDRLKPRLANAGILAHAIANYEAGLLDVDVDVIVIGLRGLTIQTIFEEIVSSAPSGDNFDMLSDLKGSLRALLIQHFLFISQSHKWRAFLEEAARSPYKREHKDDARSTGLTLSEVFEQNAGACDPRVPKAVRRVVQELDISDDAQNLSVHNALASQENTLRSLVSWMMKEAKRLGMNSWDDFSSSLSKLLGAQMAKLVFSLFSLPAVGLLASTFPERFGWLRHAIDLITGLNI